MAGSRAPNVDVVARLGSIGALGFSVAIPFVVLLTFTSPQLTSRHDFPEALLATALYLPLHVRHIRCALKGVRPRGLPLTLLAMAAVIVGFTPLLGIYWLYAYHALAASVLVTTRPRLSLPALALILIGVGIWGAHHAPSGYGSYGSAQEAVYLPAAVLARAAMVFVPVWLVRALRRIQSMRLALADQALEAERQRVDAELRRTVGAHLDDVVRRGNRLATLPASAQQAQEELASLVETSRRTLAEARRLIGSYTLASPRAELEQAAALLRAAGIDVRLEVAEEAPPSRSDQSIRTSLRAAVGDLLNGETTGPVVLRLGHTDGAYTVEALPASNAERAA